MILARKFADCWNALTALKQYNYDDAKEVLERVLKDLGQSWGGSALYWFQPNWQI